MFPLWYFPLIFYSFSVHIHSFSHILRLLKPLRIKGLLFKHGLLVDHLPRCSAAQTKGFSRTLNDSIISLIYILEINLTQRYIHSLYIPPKINFHRPCYELQNFLPSWTQALRSTSKSNDLYGWPTELVQHSADRWSSLRLKGAASQKFIWFGHCISLAYRRGGGGVG